jgi:hypothetical protein
MYKHGTLRLRRTVAARAALTGTPFSAAMDWAASYCRQEKVRTLLMVSFPSLMSSIIALHGFA